MKTAVVLVSGGMDSAVCLAKAVKLFGADQVLALSLYYGQKHVKELDCAKALAAYYHVEHRGIMMADIFDDSGCPLLQGREDVPRESYADQLAKKIGTVTTYVPFRNGLLLAHAAAIAYSVGASVIFYGAHQDSMTGDAYPDCSTSFISAMNSAIWQGTGKKVALTAPLQDLVKANVVAEGVELEVPFELTWSCYVGEDKACGTCGTCIDRQNAFKLNGLVDPITYK